MADGDRITQAGQIQWGDVLIDAVGFRDDAEAVIPANGVSGLQVPETRTLRFPVPVGAGSFAGHDVWATRKIGVTGVQIPHEDQAAAARLLASMAPRGPSAEQELIWQGFGWPSDRRFRAFARPDRPAEIYDGESATGMRRPDLSWECFDPFAYEFDQQTLTLDPGDSGTATSIGTWDTTRITVTWTGPIVGPGISTDAVPGGTITFPGLSLPTGKVIIARFHRYLRRTLASDHFSTRHLWSDAFGAGPSEMVPPPKFFPIIPGEQTITAIGSGAGTVEVAWRDAHATPPAEDEGS